mgnify:CR=1 FL=1
MWRDAATRDLLRRGGFERILASVHSGSDATGGTTELSVQFEHAPPGDVIRGYLAETARLIEGFDGFEVLAHVDYPVRYWPSGAAPYDPAEFEDEHRHVLRLLAGSGRVLEVNTTATMLVLKAAAAVFAAQQTGGSVVVQASKNTFAPGANFGAYSASKAAALQLMRIAAIEFAPLGVRVNAINADAVFGDDAVPSQLWQEVGPDRMRARSLDPQGLREHYRERSLLKETITPRHVGEAVAFFAAKPKLKGAPFTEMSFLGGQARSLYAELVKNLSTRTKPDGGALAGVVEKFVAQAKTEIGRAHV